MFYANFFNSVTSNFPDFLVCLFFGKEKKGLVIQQCIHCCLGFELEWSDCDITLLALRSAPSSVSSSI